MVSIVSFCREVQDIRRICFVPSKPVGYVLTKPAAHLRVKSNNVILAQMLQASLRPFAHGDHNAFLKHLKLFCLIKLQTPLPCVTESVRPFTRMAVAFMPNELFGPQPALSSQSQDQFDHVSMPLPVNHFLFYIEYKGSCRLKNPKKLRASRQKPLDIFVRVNTTVGVLSTICIGR